MTTEEDRKCHDRVALSDLIARLVDEVGSVPDMYASDHDRLVAVVGQITRHVWPEARGTLAPFGLDAEDVSLRPVLARIDNTRIQLTDAIDTIARMHGEVGNLRAELETTRALNQELRQQVAVYDAARAALQERVELLEGDLRAARRGAKVTIKTATVNAAATKRKKDEALQRLDQQRKKET